MLFRFLLFRNGLIQNFLSEKIAADRLLSQSPGFFQVCHGGRIQTRSGENRDAVIGLLNSKFQYFIRLTFFKKTFLAS